MARAVLFDIDGTLIRTGGAGVKAFGHAAECVFGVRNTTEKMKFAGRTDTGLARELFNNHGIATTDENFQAFFHNYVFWLDYLLPKAAGSVCPGVIDLIAELRARKNAPVIGLLTGNIRLGAEIKLRQYGLWGQFSLGAFADDHEERNQIAHVARSRVHAALEPGLGNEDIIVIGDTPHDIRCGRAIGAKVLAVATGGASYGEIQESQPDWVVKDLREISAKEICGPE